MSEEAKEIIKSIEKGILPQLKSQSKDTNSGLESSKRGLGKSKFGLETVCEQLKCTREK